MADKDELAGGLTAAAGLYDASARALAAEVLARVTAEGIETLRIVFADQHGVLRGKTVVAGALASVFRGGLAMTSTLLLKDTSHRTVFPVWEGDIGFGPGVLTGASDVLIVPDPASFRVLPWAPATGWLLCNLHFPDGRPLPFCTRALLARAVDRLADAGLAMLCGLEVEFHVFRVENPRLAHGDGGMPAAPPETSLLGHGFQYLTDARYEPVAPLMDEIRRGAQALGLPVRSMEVEFGPSQFEVTFEPAPPMAHAENMLLFRALVKETCRQRGLHATFMCRPRKPDVLPSGWHLHQSVLAAGTGESLFATPDGGLTPTASGWIAGLLEHAAATCLLSTPTVNGYKRYQPGQLAPDRIQWGRDNKGAMIRALIRPGDPAARIENRVAEPAANPFLFFASQALAGLDGVARGLSAPAPAEKPYAGKAPRLPRSLIAAIEAWEASPFVRDAFGVAFQNYLARIKRAEWERYLLTVSEWEEREYFSLF